MNYDVNKGDKKIMNNNPTVKNVNLVNDIIGDSGDTKGYKRVIIVLSVILFLIGILFFVGGKIVSGVFFFVIGGILLITTFKVKMNTKKYQINREVKNIEPLFKDNKE